MKKVLYIFLTVLSFNLSAQPPSKWYNKFGGAGIDIGYGVKETFKRHYIVAGSTSSFGYGATDAYLILVDSMGQKVWEKTYGGVMSDVAKAIVVNPVDSGFIFTGYTGSIGNGGYDVYVVRTDKNGNLIWQKSFGGLDWDFGNDIVMGPDGNVVICGYTYNSKYGQKDGYILKVNSADGVLIWEKKYGGSNHDELASVIYTSDGLISLCGTKTSNGIDNDFWLLKLNLAGDSVLSKSVTSFTTNEKCFDFIENKNNELVFCGALDTTVSMSGKYSSYLIRTDLTGGFLSQVNFTNGAIPEERFSSVCNVKNQFEICMVRKIYQGVFKLNCQPFKTQNDFTYLAATTYGDDEDDELFNIENCSDNGFIMTGYAKSYGAISEDVFLIKLDSTVFGAQSVVGVPSNTPSFMKDVYYNNNTIYFENNNLMQIDISIYNIVCDLVQQSISTSGSCKVTEHPQGIYFAVIRKENSFKKLKFIIH